jgi:hypothetical protein
MTTTPSQVGTTRRALLQAGAAGVGALALTKVSNAQTFPAPTQNRGLGPFGFLNRIMYAPTPEDMARYTEIGHEAFLNEQLDPNSILDTECEAKLRQFQSLQLSPYKCLRELPDGVNPDWECVQSQIFRAVYSKRQLQEIMVEFWLDHFSTYIYNSNREVMPTHLRTIRRYALSNFHTLLTNVVKSVNLMWYLDNLNNTIGYNNENFAREFLELHTMGVDGGYTERDVKTLTKVFTGWGMDGYYDWPWDRTTNTKWGQFKYYHEKHDTTGGYFLGDSAEHLIPSGGVEQGDLVIQRVALHPSTARHICRKLIRKFISYEGQGNLLDGAVYTFLNSNGDIRSVLRYILRDFRFAKHAKPKLKRPYHYVVSGLRVTKASVTDADALIWELFSKMKQMPFHWVPPNGYPDAMNAWVDNLRPRWYFAFQLPMNWLWDAQMDIFSLTKQRTRDAVLGAIDHRIFFHHLPALRRQQLAATMSSSPSTTQIREAFGLALASPEFQMH